MFLCKLLIQLDFCCLRGEVCFAWEKDKGIQTMILVSGIFFCFGKSSPVVFVRCEAGLVYQRWQNVGQKFCAKISVDGIWPGFCFFGNISFLVSVACVNMVCCCNLARITLHFAFNFETSFLKVSVVLLVLGET